MPDSQTKQQPEPQYGDWMLVTKKRQGVKNGRVHATVWSNQQTEVGTSGTKGDLGNSFSNMSGGNVGKAFLFQANTSQKAVPREGNVFYTPKGQKTALGSDIRDPP